MTPTQIATFIASLPCLSSFWTRKYVAQDASQGFRQPWLNNLAEGDYEVDTKVELGKLDMYMGAISSLPGMNKLGPGVRSKNLEQFHSTVVETKTLAWLAGLGLLKEIRPQLPVGTGESDFRIDLRGKGIYGEVWEPRVLPNEWWVKSPDFSMALADQRSEAPKRLRTLKGKGNSQLPPQVKGVWVAHIYHTTLRRAWAAFFRMDMATRPNLLGAAIWTSPGSRRLASEGVRLKGLIHDGHEVYWLHNMHASENMLSQQLLEILKG